MTRNINVLVYAGPGSSPESVRHCLYSLESLLSPHYAVLTVSAEALLTQPWQSSCALLVLPGGADLGYCKTLNGQGNGKIKQYINGGGSYLGFCAGGYYGSSRCEFEVGNNSLAVVGPRELAFYPGTCRGSAFSGFEYNSEAGTKAAQIARVTQASQGEEVPFMVYFNGGSIFVDAEKFRDHGVEILAKYLDSLDVDFGAGIAAAVVYCKVGKGRVILTGPHPEFASKNLNKHAKGLQPGIIDALKASESARQDFLRYCLERLTLTVNQNPRELPKLSTLFITSSDTVRAIYDTIAQSLVTRGRYFYLEGAMDTFAVEHFSGTIPSAGVTEDLEPAKHLESGRNDVQDGRDDFEDTGSAIKMVRFCAEVPRDSETPNFSHRDYYASLKDYSNYSSAGESFGSHLIYGDVVTSTNTLLEKYVSWEIRLKFRNTVLTSALPQGTTFLATTQTSGRGRGSNTWVSSTGSLLFSTVLRHPLTLNAKAPVVFTQYLVAIAIAEAIQTYDLIAQDPMSLAERSIDSRYRSIPVKLKWPNDVYALDPQRDMNLPTGHPRSYCKIGGILVNTTYASGEYTMVVGVGLNVSNEGPTTNLNDIILALNACRSSVDALDAFKPEKLLARILVTLSQLYTHFSVHGFSGVLENLYYKHWLHTEQVIQLEEQSGTKARIKGISHDIGMLVAEELVELPNGITLGTSRRFALQSDSNSFDFFKGLVRRKIA